MKIPWPRTADRGAEIVARCNLDPEACAEETIPAACRELGHRWWKRAEPRCGRARYPTAWRGVAQHGKAKHDTPRNTAYQERKRGREREREMLKKCR